MSALRDPGSQPITLSGASRAFRSPSRAPREVGLGPRPSVLLPTHRRLRPHRQAGPQPRPDFIHFRPCVTNNPLPQRGPLAVTFPPHHEGGGPPRAQICSRHSFVRSPPRPLRPRRPHSHLRPLHVPAGLSDPTRVLTVHLVPLSRHTMLGMLLARAASLSICRCHPLGQLLNPQTQLRGHLLLEAFPDPTYGLAAPGAPSGLPELLVRLVASVHLIINYTT